MGADAVITLPQRVVRLERRVDDHDTVLAKFETKDAVFAERLDGAIRAADGLKDTMDKVLWALIGLATTIAVACVAALLALA